MMLYGEETTLFKGQLPLPDRQYGSGGSCQGEAWVGFPPYVQLAHKTLRILEWEGRALKRIWLLLAVLYMFIMLKCMWEQIPSASRSGGEQPRQAALGKEAPRPDLAWH